MKNVLFINSCVRGVALSRTLKIANAFLDVIKRLQPEITITEKNLMEINPQYMSYSNFPQREQLLHAKKFDHPLFDMAKEFAAADRIVIAAPFWEYSFPTILSAYIENISIPEITFQHTSAGCSGMCKAEKMIYITSRGSDFSAKEFSDYKLDEKRLKALCEMYGICKFDSISAEGLDSFGVNPEEIVKKSIQTAIEKANQFL